MVHSMTLGASTPAVTVVVTVLAGAVTVVVVVLVAVVVTVLVVSPGAAGWAQPTITINDTSRAATIKNINLFIKLLLVLLMGC